MKDNFYLWLLGVGLNSCHVLPQLSLMLLKTLTVDPLKVKLTSDKPRHAHTNLITARRRNTDFNWSQYCICTISLSDVLQRKFGEVSPEHVAWSCSKTWTRTWVLFNIRTVTPSSPPTSFFDLVDRKWLDVSQKQSIWKSNPLEHELLPWTFDLVCSCWFWEWEMVRPYECFASQSSWCTLTTLSCVAYK